MKYYIAGNRGLVGRNYMQFCADNDIEVVGGNTSTIDYSDKEQTIAELEKHQPTHVVINAATTGGLQEDMDRGFELMSLNLIIQNNLFNAAHHCGVERLLLQGSTCSFPLHNDIIPYTEETLMMGEPHPIYLPTAMPKLMGMYQCRASNERNGSSWRTAIDCNMFGPGDRTGEHAHVIGALMSKFVHAVRNNESTVEIWGDGTQSRDFMYIEDAVAAQDIILNNDVHDTVNVASGTEITIAEIAELMIRVSGFKGSLWYNTDRPSGIKNRPVSNDRLKELGWKPKFSIEDAFAKTYEWYNDNT
tara:strand:- start:3624 stop:4532 length:909 start_codon:yes stop_codon:yes gene_type:complete